MKLYYKIFTIFGFLFSFSAQSKEMAVSFTATTVSDVLRTVQRIPDEIKPQDLEDKELAGLLNRPIPKLSEIYDFNPPQVINQEIKLGFDGTVKRYLVKEFELCLSHWFLETKTRMAVGLLGGYVLGNASLYLVASLINPAVTVTMFFLVAAGGGYYYFKDSPVLQAAQTQNLLAQVEKKGANVKEVVSTAVLQETHVDGTALTLANLLRDNEMVLKPTFAYGEDKEVLCIYEGSIKQSHGKLVNYRIVLQAL